MEKFIPYEKLSKKEQRKLNAARRGSWGETNPVTRKANSKKVYDRKKLRSLEREPYGRPSFGVFFFYLPRFL